MTRPPLKGSVLINEILEALKLTKLASTAGQNFKQCKQNSLLLLVNVLADSFCHIMWNFSNTHIVAHIITQDTRVVSKKFESKLSVVSVFKFRNELSISNFLKIVVFYFDFCKEPNVKFEPKTVGDLGELLKETLSS